MAEAAALLCSAPALGQQPPQPAASPVGAQPSVVPAGPEARPDTPSEGATAPGAARPRGFEPGFRSGLDLPLGKAGNDARQSPRNLSDLTSYRVPVWAELFYRFSDEFRAGVYGMVGLGAVGDACRGDCSWSQLRLGLQGEWSLSRSETRDIWFGVGAGYQWLAFNSLRIAGDAARELADTLGIDFELPDVLTEQQIADLEVTPLRRIERLSGPELLLHAGVDFQVEPGLGIGPYISANVSTFASNSRSCAGLASNLRVLCPDVSDEGSRVHAWLGVGLRGTYQP